MSSEVADHVWARQYAHHADETFEQGADRVVDHVVGDRKELKRWAPYWRAIIKSKRFIPGGRVLAGAASNHGNLQNCFVQGPTAGYTLDSQVLDLAKKLALVTKVGGGNGVNLDFVPAKREYRARVGNLWLYIDPDHPDYEDVRTGTFLDQVTGQRVTRGYHTAYVSQHPDRPFEAVVKRQVPDSVEGIWETAHEVVLDLLQGRNVLVDLSELRPEGTPVQGSGGTSSGPASFAVEVFDNFAKWAKLGGADYAGPVATLRYVFAPTLRVIRQAGVRRGAGMATLSVTHPDVMDFVTAKTIEREKAEGDISTFNISVLVRQEDIAELMDRRDTPVVAALKAAVAQAWATGEPGFLFVDRINRHNALAEVDGPIVSTNPCVTGDTRILTVDGPRTFFDLAESGEDVDVWCIDLETNQPRISTMRNPRLTRRNAELVEVTFDSGLKVRVTPDHNFFTTQRNKVQAKDLVPGQSVSAFHIHQHRDGHLRILRNQKPDHQAKQWFVHRLIAEHYGMDIEGKVVHHIDGDPTNNTVENLQVMTPEEHNSHHYPERLEAGFYNQSQAAYYNHKVVSVVPVEPDDVYNGTVDTYHNYIILDDVPTGQSFLSGVVSANCGEQPLYPGESCNLGAINVAAYWDELDRHFQWNRLWSDVKAAVRFLDAVHDADNSPLPEIREQTKDKRRLGLGLMGLGDLLIKMGIRYGSKKAQEFAEALARSMTAAAIEASEELAEEFGACPAWERVPDHVKHGRKPRRNIALMTVAPTGTISMLAGVSSGIEPVYSATIKRRIGTEYKTIKHPLAGYPHFITAHQVSPKEHVKMQAAVQRGFDWDVDGRPSAAGNAISKTINLPNSASVDGILDALVIAYGSGSKGFTCYRDGSRDLQVLTEVKEGDKAPDDAEYRDVEQLATLERRKPVRPAVVEGKTYRYTVGERKVYVTVNRDEHDHPIEVFVNLSRPTDKERVAADIIGRLISLALKHGAPAEDVVRHLSGHMDGTGFFATTDEEEPKPVGYFGTLWEAVARSIQDDSSPVTEVQQEARSESCPSCGEPTLVKEGTCTHCETCGWSKCG